MWNRIVEWHRGWESDQIMVLENPASVEQIPPGVRRKMHGVLAQLSPVERMQLRQFCEKYRGWRGYAMLGKLLVLFSLIGVALHLALPDKSLVKSIVMANVLGVAVLLTFSAAYFNYRKMVGKSLRIGLILVLCAGLGALVGASEAAREKGIGLQEAIETRWLNAMLIGLGAGLFIAVPMAVVGALRNQQYHALTAQLELDAERERAGRALSESRLRMLHAQIEPHFLFNTLGAVQQLAEKEAPRAAELTADLIAFLRASLAEMRSERVTLDADFGLIDAYLKVMKVRLGERLRYTLSLPAPLAQVTVPSMMLLTLVENAIKHGIEPALRGGELHVSAEQQGTRIRLSVRDTGAGMGEQPGSGDGLENVRSRLQLIYGAAASLTVEDAADGGVLADIVLPINQEKASA
jgi:sensor histidine kinase YesM